MSLGLDTTVVLRLIVGEPVGQTAAARSMIEAAFARGERVSVSDLVAAEAYYALRYHYGLEKAHARERLLAMLTSGVVELDPPGSISAFESARGAGLVDRLIASRYSAGGSTTLTFDRRLARLPGVEILPSR